MNENDVERMFRLTPPGAEPFEVALVRSGAGYEVFSRRSGKWGKETAIHLADLLMPEQRLGEWDVEEVKPKAA